MACCRIPQFENIVVEPLNRIGFDLGDGGTLGLVGETGKSVTPRLVLILIRPPIQKFLWTLYLRRIRV
jgi:ABC-type oligopeptide transport system ATPase subunit